MVYRSHCAKTPVADKRELILEVVKVSIRILRIIGRTFSRITRMDLRIFYGGYVTPSVEYANQVLYSGRTKDVTLIERAQQAGTKMAAGLKSVDYETLLTALDLFPLEYRHLRGDLILAYALFEQGERQPLNDKNKPELGNLGESFDPVYLVSFGGDAENDFDAHDDNESEDITRIDAKKNLGRTKDVTLIERAQQAGTKMAAGLKSVDYETLLTALDLFPLEYRHLRGDLILAYALFEQGERQPLNDKNKPELGNLGESFDPVCQSANPCNSATHIAVFDLGWDKPTDVQQAVIPLMFERKSIVVQARTGSGKTAAFALPVLNFLLQEKQLQTRQTTTVLVLAPSKELCSQAYKNFRLLCKYASKNVSFIDVSQYHDVEILRPLLVENPDIVIGTPARILSHLRSGHITLASLKQLVIDEADLIFTFGYQTEIEEIRGFFPTTPFQIVLMSATLDDTTKILRRCLVKGGDWVRVELPEEAFLPSDSQLTQYIIRQVTIAICAEEEDKYTILIALVKLKLIRGKTLIFTNSVDRCFKLVTLLRKIRKKNNTSEIERLDHEANLQK
ncbi:ATP-dependent RNA helicase DDX56/DBP9, partial [Clonorchis sinensis]